MNTFRGAGIYPLDFSSLHESRFAPSRVYHQEELENSSDVHSGCQHSHEQIQKQKRLALAELEAVISKETLKKYETRYKEGYDLDIDAEYNVWKKLNDLQSATRVQSGEPHLSAISINLTPGRATVAVSSHIDEILVIPKKLTKAKNSAGKPSEISRHLSSKQMIAMLE